MSPVSPAGQSKRRAGSLERYFHIEPSQYGHLDPAIWNRADGVYDGVTEGRGERRVDLRRVFASRRLRGNGSEMSWSLFLVTLPSPMPLAVTCRHSSLTATPPTFTNSHIRAHSPTLTPKSSSRSDHSRLDLRVPLPRSS